MRQLADILKEKIEKVHGKAALGRLLGVSGEAILQYTQGRMPSMAVAIKWKEVFNENLIELMFDGDEPTIVGEPLVPYGGITELEYWKTQFAMAKNDLRLCLEEKQRLLAELSRFKTASEEK